MGEIVGGEVNESGDGNESHKGKGKGDDRGNGYAVAATLAEGGGDVGESFEGVFARIGGRL